MLFRSMMRGSCAGDVIAEGLHEFLVKVEEECSVVSDSIYGDYMSLG